MTKNGKHLETFVSAGRGSSLNAMCHPANMTSIKTREQSRLGTIQRRMQKGKTLRKLQELKGTFLGDWKYLIELQTALKQLYFIQKQGCKNSEECRVRWTENIQQEPGWTEAETKGRK